MSSTSLLQIGNFIKIWIFGFKILIFRFKTPPVKPLMQFWVIRILNDYSKISNLQKHSEKIRWLKFYRDLRRYPKWIRSNVRIIKLPRQPSSNNRVYDFNKVFKVSLIVWPLLFSISTLIWSEKQADQIHALVKGRAFKITFFILKLLICLENDN